jgi:hypothetical protein
LFPIRSLDWNYGRIRFTTEPKSHEPTKSCCCPI